MLYCTQGQCPDCRWQMETGLMKNNQNLSLLNKITIGTWNVHGMLQLGKIQIIGRKMTKSNIHVLEITETYRESKLLLYTTKIFNIYMPARQAKWNANAGVSEETKRHSIANKSRALFRKVKYSSQNLGIETQDALLVWESSGEVAKWLLRFI